MPDTDPARGGIQPAMKTLRQAGCVAIRGCGVLIEGEPGSGKSSLALALIDRGAEFVGDDGVALTVRDGRLWAAPPPHTAGQLEIRNVGIACLAAIEAPVCLHVELTAEAPRFVEVAPSIEIAGCALPSLALFPNAPALPLRVERALAMHGLAPSHPFQSV